MSTLLAVVLVILMPSLRSYLEQRSQIADLKDQKAHLSRSVQALEAEKKRWDDPNFVKAQATERLGYAMPGQKVTIYVDRNNQAHAVGSGAEQNYLKDHPWYGQVWSSISTKTNVEK